MLHHHDQSSRVRRQDLTDALMSKFQMHPTAEPPGKGSAAGRTTPKRVALSPRYGTGKRKTVYMACETWKVAREVARLGGYRWLHGENAMTPTQVRDFKIAISNSPVKFADDRNESLLEEVFALADGESGGLMVVIEPEPLK